MRQKIQGESFGLLITQDYKLKKHVPVPNLHHSNSNTEVISITAPLFLVIGKNEEVLGIKLKKKLIMITNSNL